MRVTPLLACLLSCLIGASAPRAGPLEDAYLADRDALIEKFTAIDKAGKADDRTFADMTAALAHLEKTLEGIVGRDHFAGLADAPKIHLDTLFKTDEGYGMLDGLDYASPDHKTVVTVTTAALLRHWLTEHKNWWGKGMDMPASFDQAVRSEAFFTQAISTDAAVVTYGEIPIVERAGDEAAVAFLAATTQAESPRLPDRMIVLVIGKARAFIIVAPMRAEIAPIPACTAIWDETEKKIAAFETTTDPKGNPGEDANRLRDVADSAYRRCFAEKAKTESAFAAVTHAARQLVDALPKR